MNRSLIIQKMIQIGVLLEKGHVEYSGAEIDANILLDEILSGNKITKDEVEKNICEHDWQFKMSVNSPLGNKCSKCGEVR
jgi:hypothetical protein